MIKKVSVFLNISAMAVSAYCLLFLIGRVGSYDQGTNRIKSIEKETKEILAKLEEFKKEHALKYSSERSKIKDWKKQNLSLRRTYPNKHDF